MRGRKKEGLGRKNKTGYVVVDERVLKPEKLEETITLSKRILMEREKEKETGMLAFIFGQMRFISKGTWAVKAFVFLGMFFSLYVIRPEGGKSAEQMMAVASSLLVLTAMPEIWKNIRYRAVDVESCTRFGLKKAYLARFLLLGMTDLCMATFFVLCANRWISSSFYQIAVWLLVPYNSMLMICLSIMAFGKRGSESMAEAGGALWMAVVFWLTGYWHIYEKVQLFMWGILLAASYVYLIFVIGRIVKSANRLSEVEYVRN